MPTTNNPLTEIGAIVLAALFVIGGVILLYVGKIDIAFASSMFILAAGLLGFTGALKAPSPAQQQQIGTLADHQQQLTSQQQALTSQVLGVLPAVVQAQQQPVVQVPPSELNLRPGQAVNVMSPPGTAAVAASSWQPQAQPQQFRPVPGVPDFSAPLQVAPRG